jgi:type IV pilus assembly protein PilZ
MNTPKPPAGATTDPTPQAGSATSQVPTAMMPVSNATIGVATMTAPSIMAASSSGGLLANNASNSAPDLQGVAPRSGSVLSISIKEKAALYASYMPFFINGGLFIPTSKSYQPGDQILLSVNLFEGQYKLPIAGEVAWITPAKSLSGRAQGIGVHFLGDESGKNAKAKIEELLGSAVRSTRPTHTM